MGHVIDRCEYKTIKTTSKLIYYKISKTQNKETINICKI